MYGGQTIAFVRHLFIIAPAILSEPKSRMASYLSLEEAAKQLGITTERLVELRSQGEVRGFRDGASWKFPDSEIARIKDDPGDLLRGDEASEDSGVGSDLGLGTETLQPGSGSDVNLVASSGDGSDVAVVASGSDLDFDGESDKLLEIDSGELELADRAVMHDSGLLDLAIEPNAGSTGPVTDEELKEISESHPDVLAPESGNAAAGGSSSGGGSVLDLGGEMDDIKLNSGSDLSFSGSAVDEDSGEELIGDDDSGMDVIGSDIAKQGSKLSSAGASSLEMMDDLDGSSKEDEIAALGSKDVLSELDLLSAEQEGSGLISGDSENLLVSSGLGSSIGADVLAGSDLSALEDDDALASDDALAADDDDDLVIADDDDLVISSEDSDISVAGDSGINLMSPSDSGLSLESEPLDLAGSSISALDLGAELSDGGSSGSGRGSGSGGSSVDFQDDEEFQLSPSGVGLDTDVDSGSQVIEVEESAAIGEAVEFGDEVVEDDVFGAEEVEAEEDALAMGEEDGVAIDQSGAVASVAPSMGGYEVPFSLLQCVALVMIISVLCMGGMLMTDLVRNMWSYAEPSAPVSSLTDSLISLMGWGH